MTTKKKKSVKKRTSPASALSKLERQAASVSSKRMSLTNTQRQVAKFFTVLIVIIVIFSGGVMLFSASKSYNEERADKQRYVDLREIMGRLRKQLESSSTKNIQWVQTDTCYSWIAEESKRGWNCSSELETNIQYNSPTLKSSTKVFEDTLQKSKTLELVRSDAIQDSVSGISETIGFTPKQYELKDINLTCDTQINSSEDEVIRGTIKLTLFCEGGAKKSWYKNNESVRTESLNPGVNAWKELE